MKHLALALVSLLSGCFYAEAQFPVTDPSLAEADFSESYSGSYGNGIYFENQAQYGLYYFSYAAITPPPGPFYNQIYAQTDIYGYTATTPPYMGITASIAPSSLSGVSLDAKAEMIYLFTIAGTPGSLVNVNVAASILGNTTQLTSPPFFTESATSSFYVADSLANLNAANALTYVSGSTTANPSGFSSSTLSNPTLTLTAGDTYYVELNSEVVLNGTFGNTTVYGNAGVDPTFTLTPEEEAGGYTLEFSPGIITPTPEPSTWALLVPGLGILAFFVGRKTIKA
jgi:hypothetical protein